ncbi:hypothetical protein AND_005651 [Anopheles darlingi]|uniref:C2h2-type zn-finger protein n=1 Tax=Anopheles darlingi TaxID=43151 RepID=W5JID0_ANODA|nr:hypothetical protein AND_005651 [Anopheles darlingi]
MYEVCRLCAKVPDAFVLVRESRIFSALTNKEVCLDELIEQYLSISKQSLMDDSSICGVCWTAIEQWHNFREGCLQNEERLKSLHTNIENDVLCGKEYNFAIEYVDDESSLCEDKPPEETHYEEVHEIEETVQYEEVKELKVEVVEETSESSVVISVEDRKSPEKEIDCAVKPERETDHETFSDDEKKEVDGKDKLIRSRIRKGRRKGQTKQASRPTKDATKSKRILYKQASGAGQSNSRLCPICGAARTDMTAHLRWHNNERPYHCPYCPKIFVNSSNLRNHVNLHTRQKMYKCDLCDKEFASTTGRNKHRLTHATEREFLCPVCGLSFKHQASLVRHKLIHYEEPKIKCTDCDKVFLTKTRLKKHFLVHLKEKPFNCEVCNKAFNRKDNLKVHIKTHSKQRFKFTEC